jgi:alkylated DNA repair dioxygenase AlkB
VLTLTWQPSLLGQDPPDVDVDLHGARRRFLGAGAWVDHVPGWVHAADALFDELVATTEWAVPPDRPMYDRIVAVPRMVAVGGTDHPPIVRRMARHLGRHYGRNLSNITSSLYRDGRDSVAWHGDRIGRRHPDTVVCIVSLGATRTFLLRPNGGGSSLSYSLHSGDLLVMGGTCQRTFEHCVPKRAHAGPRMSLMFRELGVA